MAKAVSSINLADGAEANSNAKKVATNYLASDSTGIMVAELSGSAETPSTATGNNVRITSTTVDVRKGQNTLTSMGQSGMQIYNGSGTQIANLGYGSGASASGTADAPYYDLGVRASNSTKGNYSVAEGYGTTASGYLSHAEGDGSTASGRRGHAEGTLTTAGGDSSHAEGNDTTASGSSSHAEGAGTTASGNYSHAQNYYTTISENYGTVLGKFNSTTSGYPLVIGGGTASNAKKDIFKMDWNGNTDMAGQVKTSFKSSVAMGSYGTAQTTVDGLVGEVRYSSGCMGSASINTAYTHNGLTIPTGWYNFIYSPHRSGGNSGSASGDNCDYGNLLLMGMNNTNGMYKVRVSSGAIADITYMDVITASGTDGDWYYEKWSNGKVEAVFRGSVSYTSMSASGQLYRSVSNSVAIPSGIFSATPQRTQITVNSGNTVVVSATGTAMSATSVSVEIWRSTNANSSIDCTITCTYTP